MLGSFAEKYQLSKEHAVRLAAAFGGGIARSGQICGAVSGALLVIGLAHGATLADDVASRERTYAMVTEFRKQFQSDHGSVVCRELLGVDLGMPGGREAALRDGLFKLKCPIFVRAAVEIVGRFV